jgi:hypothetical protein
MNTLKFNQIEFNHIGEQPSMQLQEKSVTIKENGTIEIVPDSGYALDKVNITTDIKGSGGGDITYFDLTDISSSGFNILDVIDYLGGMLKAKVTSISGGHYTEEGDVIIFPSPMIYKFTAYMSFEPMGAGLCLSDMICIEKQQFTVEEALKELLTTELFDKVPRITKEEFYNLNV